MPTITHHDSTDDSILYSDFDSSSLIDNKDLDTTLEKFDTALAQLDSLKNANADTLVGNSTLTDGGTVGRYLNLFMAYIEDFRKKGALDKKELGAVYGRAMEIAATNALQLELSGSEAVIAKTKALSELAIGISSTNESSTRNALTRVEVAKAVYEYERMLPIQRASLEEEVEIKHIQHQSEEVSKNTAVYTLSNILPKEASKLDGDITMLGKQAELSDVQKAIEQYRLDTVLPKEMDKIDTDIEIAGKNIELLELQVTEVVPAEINKLEQDVVIATKNAEIAGEKLEIVREELSIKQYELSTMLPAQVGKITADTALVNADKAIKDYYKNNVQPKEAQLTDAKAVQERINAGLVGGGTPLPAARIAQLEKQTELYTRQEEAYDDNKYQKLLDTQVNYNAMVFADDPNPQILTACSASAVTDTYDALKPPP